MKIIITESRYKNIIFRYFDKFGGKIDNLFIQNFGLDNRGNEINYNDAYRYLIEWRGEEESKELTKILLLKNSHKNNDCGGYDFFFEVTGIRQWSLNEEGPFLICEVLIDDIGGDVLLFDGTTRNLRDYMNDEEYGWEIKSEVDWCVNTYFKENITYQTGVDIIYDINFISER